MIGAILLVGGAFFGAGLNRRLFARSLNSAEQALWGLVVGWSLMAAVAYGFARITGSVGLGTIAPTLILVGLGAIFCWLPTIRGNEAARWFVWEKSFAPLLMVLCLFAPVLLKLFVTHMLQTGADGGIYSGGESTYYDMAYHSAITTSFVSGNNFPPIYPPFPPAPLLYPFLPDFLTALLIATGWDLHSALVWTAVPLSLALIGIFYLFALRLIAIDGTASPLHEGWIAAIATLLFFFNGGLGFVYFVQDWRQSSMSLWQFLTHLDVNYTHLPSKALVWPNVIVDMLLPQRTSLFGLALGLIILSCFAMVWTGTGDHKKWTGRKHLFAAGIVAGLLPFFHVHSYIAVGLISAVLFLLRPRRVWLLFWAPAVVIAFPRFLEFSQYLAGAGFARFQPGWRGQGQSSWTLFWLRNIGLPAVLIIPAWLTAPRPLRFFYVAFLALLSLALLVILSPNDYDNLKLMIYWYAATAVLIALWLCRLVRSRVSWVLVPALVIISIASGGLAIAVEMRSKRLMFSQDEVAAATFVKANTAPHSLFLTAPSLHQPILTLAGRRVVRGPTAWLWSHGYPFAEREADVRAIYAGRDDALALLRYYRVDYIYVGRRELDELKAKPDFFEALLPVAFHKGDITIYDGRKLKDGDVSPFAGYPPREYASRVDRDPAQILTEFPAVAYELYRLRKTAFGGAPGYRDFLSDLHTLGRDLYPGRPDWKQTRENNEASFTDALVEQSAFRERYDRMTDAEYVAALFANAGVHPSNGESAVLVASLGAHRDTRATVLRRVATERRLFERDYNAAYVLCHYFGYLKRDPDQAPDHDFTGFNFWREQLDRTRDYRGLTRAFLESDEYKKN